MSTFSAVGIGRCLLDVDALGAAGIARVLDLAESLRPHAGRGPAPEPLLRGRTVVSFFYEASTRTRLSFEIAAQKLGADVLSASAEGSSVVKGESLVDTARTLDSLGAHAVVLRHPEAGAPYLFARHFGGAVVNAGDGRHAHPTQALLDLLTLRERFGRIEGLRVAIVGDAEHSRVARSTAFGLLLCGAAVRLCGPATLLPHVGLAASLPPEASGTLSMTTSMEDALRRADVVMALRMQAERQRTGLVPAGGEYTKQYGVTPEALARYAPDALVMHPGPANEGVEIAPALMAADRSLIGRQVTNGVLVRMAVLLLLLGGDDA